MLRPILCATLLMVAQSLASAADHSTPRNIGIGRPDEAKPIATASGRKKIETILQSPANLDFGEHQSVTFRELLDQLHKEHHLSFRFDTRSVMLATAADSAVADTNDPFKAAIDRSIDIGSIDLKTVSVNTVLRHALDAVGIASPLDDETENVLPIHVTEAYRLDYLVEDDGLLVTSRMNALMAKETRVYSIKGPKNVSPSELADVVRRAVRPWSWRSHINDLADQLKSSPNSGGQEIVNALVKTGMQFASFAEPVAPASEHHGDKEVPAPRCDCPAAGPSPAAPSAQPSSDGCVSITDAGALTTLAQATISALEIMHYADPPTGTIQTLPGKLVITQSQAAHREIADLLKQLEDE